MSTMLVVEDDRATRRLKLQGPEVIAASNVAERLARARALRPALAPRPLLRTLPRRDAE